jgi:hypothetical protein
LSDPTKGSTIDVPPQLEQIAAAVAGVSSKLEYPIKDQEHGSALLGEDAKVEYEGRSYSVAELRKLIPPEYFPIESEPDLIAKIADLELRHSDRAAKFTPERADERPRPDVPIEISDEDRPPPGAGPAVRPVKR